MDGMVLSSEDDRALTQLLDKRFNPDCDHRVRAFVEWYEISERYILKHLVCLIGNGTDIDDPMVQDIAQEAIWLGYQAVTKGDFEYWGTTFTTYVKKIAKNQLANYYRQLKPSISMDELDQDNKELAQISEPSVEEALNEDVQIARQFIATFSEERRRKVFELHYLRGCSYTDIAATLEVSEAVVRQDICRGLKQLRKVAKNFWG